MMNESRLVRFNSSCFIYFHWLIMCSIDSFDKDDSISLGQTIHHGPRGSLDLSMNMQ